MKRSIQAGKQESGGVSFSILSHADLDQIHAATLEILWKNGIFVEDKEALEIFDGGGATVNPKTKIVKIPPHVLEDAVNSAPEIFVMAGRVPENDKILGGNRVGFNAFGEGITVVDPKTSELREPTKADLADCSRLSDYLNNIDICHRTMGAHDVLQEAAAVHNAEAELLNTTKHCLIGPQSGFLAKKIVEMAAAIVGGKEMLRERPLMTFATCPISPLKLVQDCCEIIIETVRSGLGLLVLSEVMAGGTSVVTLAGTLTTHNAEVLSGLVLSQLAQKGAPFTYGSSTCSLDLRLGTAAVGNPETALLSAAVAQMARYYRLPSFVAGG
jgi:trimethylamine--corrinoid protein Co-methyltransferase